MRTFAQKQNQPHKQASSSFARSDTVNLGANHHANTFPHLQSTVGNQAVQRLLQHQSNDLKAGPVAQVAAPMVNDFRGIQVHPKSPVKLQAKLAVNTAGDIYEQEADRTAEQVMRMPNLTQATDKSPNSLTNLVQRRVDGSGSGLEEAPPSVQEVLSSPGRPLDAATRAFMEPRFSHDFSRVRVHSDAATEQSAQDVNAHAYTVGHDMVFGVGRFAPETNEGRRLIAHELAHVVQQSGSAAAVQRAPTPAADPSAEHAAVGAEAEAVVQLNWERDLDGPDFVDRLVAVVSRYRDFRGVPKDHIRAALMVPGGNFFTKHMLMFKTGQQVQLRITASFDRGDLQHMWVASDEPRPTSDPKTSPPNTTTESPRSKAGDPQIQARKPEPYEEAFGEIKLSGGRVSVLLWGDPKSSVPDEQRIHHLIRADVLYRHPEGEPAEAVEFMAFIRTPGDKWFLGPAYHWPWRLREPTAAPHRQRSTSEEFESETGWVYPQKINKGLHDIAAQALKEADPTSLKNLPYTIAGVVVPIGAMKLITMDTGELSGLVRFEWQIDEDLLVQESELDTIGTPSAAKPGPSGPTSAPRNTQVGDIISTSKGTQRVVQIEPSKLFTEPYVEPQATQTVSPPPKAAPSVTETASPKQVTSSAVDPGAAKGTAQKQLPPGSTPPAQKQVQPPPKATTQREMEEAAAQQKAMVTTKGETPRKGSQTPKGKLEFERGRQEPSANEIKGGPSSLSEHIEELADVPTPQEKLTTRRKGEKPLTEKSIKAVAGGQMEKQAIKWLKQELDGPAVKVLANEEFPPEIKRAFKKEGVKGPDAIVVDRKNKTLSVVDSTTKSVTKHEAKTMRDRNILEQNLPKEYRDEGFRVGPPSEIVTDSKTGEFELNRGK